MDIFEKLQILTDGAKYDAACTSGGTERRGKQGSMGSASVAGCCHSFAADGRCISLLKVLMSNACVYNCAYCVNRRENDCRRATFEPRELADLVMQFYRRNYIEGLFLSSAVVGTPDYTCELMERALAILRHEYGFNGYIHVKGIPGASEALIYRLGCLADRISVNIELPSSESLALLAPQKRKTDILGQMGYIEGGIQESRHELVRYRSAPRFAPAGQSTQMIVGATGESDYAILRLTEGLYRKYALKRVFFSAYMPVVSNPLLPSADIKPPLLREHRLYQADWLLRYYGFAAEEILDAEHDTFHPLLDPKCNWAISHPECFPVDVMHADYEMLLRVPGIGVRSAKRIVAARRHSVLDFAALKRIGVVLKRARYFILSDGKTPDGIRPMQGERLIPLLADNGAQAAGMPYEQLSFFAPALPTAADIRKSLTGEL